MKNSVSVLMPTYNHEQYIGKAISSVLDQKYSGKLEIHVFDDFSTDKTVEILLGYVEKYPDKVNIYQNPKNLGSGLASYTYHQVAIETEYWCILEGDDYWISDCFLQKKVDVLSNDTKLVGCSGNTEVLKEIEKNKLSKDILISTHFQTFNLADCAYFHEKYGFYLHTSSFLWRNIYHHNIPPFPDKFFDPECPKGDPALVILMMGTNFSIHRLDEIISAYRVSGKGRWSKLSEAEQKKRNIKYEKKILSFYPPRHRFLFSMMSSKYSKLLYFFKKKIANYMIKKGILPMPVNWVK